MTRSLFRITMVLLALCPWLPAQARPSCQVVPKTLKAMHGCYRPLLVFSPTARDGRLKRQAELLDEAADDMMDRFVLFTPVVPEAGMVPEGKQVPTPLDAPWAVPGGQEMSGIRARFHIPASQFAVLLLDEDGTVRLRSDRPVSFERLNALIDRTPRRKAERLRPHAN